MTCGLDRIVGREVPPGVYRMDMSITSGSICAKAAAAGWRCVYLDGRGINNKQSLMKVAAKAFQFPAYFGDNWDALEECLTEPGLFEESEILLLYDHVAVLYAQHPTEWAIFYDIINSAISYWSSQACNLYVVLRNTGTIPQKVSAL